MMAEKTSGLSAEERAAVKQRAAELRAQEKAGKNRAAGEQAIQDAITEMPADDQVLAQGIHRIVGEVASHLMASSRLRYPSSS